MSKVRWLELKVEFKKLKHQLIRLITGEDHEGARDPLSIQHPEN
jgi:hypothetical protein